MIYNGTYTLENVETGEHRTFDISTQPKDAKFAPGRRVLSVMVGPDNNTSYKGFAFINSDGTIQVWHKYKGYPRKSRYEYYAALLQQLNVTVDEREQIKELVQLQGRAYNVMLSKTCVVCNRKLTTPESIMLGIGPICKGIR